MLVNSEPAYILHKRAFRETSQILDVFSRNHGRLSLMAKGSRHPRARLGSVLQPFRPLVIGWQGRGDLPLLRTADAADKGPPAMAGRSLLPATYLNELLVRLLHKNDVHQDVFDHYHHCLYQLPHTASIEIVLRTFEKNLLRELGFGLNLSSDADSGEPVQQDCYYRYHFEHGPVQCQQGTVSRSQPVLSGDSLLAFDQDRLLPGPQCTQVKALMRYVLHHHLGGRPLRSRELFRRNARPTASA